jgi:hypothetical protein
MEIYDAFGIPRVDWRTKAMPRTQKPPLNQNPSLTPDTTSAPTIDRADAWTKVFDEWRRNGVLNSTDANKLRNYLSDAVSSFIDANALLINEVKKIPRIYLPRATQGNPELHKAVIVAATEDDFGNEETGATFITSMQAVVRYHERKHWNYDGGEFDYARYTNFISNLARQAEVYFINQGNLISRDGIKPVAQALLIGARVLNLPGASANTDAENLSAMLAEAPVDQAISSEPQTPWQRLKSGAYRSRTELSNALLDLISARQGTGEKVHALDSIPLLEAIKDLREKKWTLEEDPTDRFSLPTQGIKEHLRQLRNTTIVTQRGDEIVEWADRVTANFGTDFDAGDLVANMRSSITEARNAGVFRCRNKEPSDLLPRIKDGTSLGAIRDHLSKAERVRENREKFDIVLTCVAQVEDSLMERVSSLISDYEIFLAETESTVSEKLLDVPTDLEETTSQLRAELELLGGNWERIGQTL